MELVVAQDFEIQKYDLGELLDFPTKISFAEEDSGNLWLLYSKTEEGEIKNQLVILEGEEWQEVNFSGCTGCIEDMKAGPQGNIYLAAGNMGIYKWEESSWKVFLDKEALGIDWNSDGELVIVNGEGLFTYNGTELISANNENVPFFERISDLKVDLLDEAYLILGSELFQNTQAEGWVQKTELEAPMSMDVDSENRLWVTDNVGEIGYYLEGDYAGGTYFNFGTNDLAIDGEDVLWYASSSLVRNENGAELSIDLEDLIDDALFIQTVYASNDNSIWVASNFASSIAKVEYLGNASGITQASEAEALHLSPNPVGQYLNLAIAAEPDEKFTIRVYDSSGQLLEAIPDPPGSGTYSINAEHYPPGMYLVNVLLEGGMVNSKFIKY